MKGELQRSTTLRRLGLVSHVGPVEKILMFLQRVSYLIPSSKWEFDDRERVPAFSLGLDYDHPTQ